MNSQTSDSGWAFMANMIAGSGELSAVNAGDSWALVSGKYNINLCIAILNSLSNEEH